MRTVTAVDPLWLAELGPMFFSIGDDRRDAVDAKAEMKAQARQMEVEFEKKLAVERKLQEDKDRAQEASRAADSVTVVASIGGAKKTKRRHITLEPNQ